MSLKEMMIKHIRKITGDENADLWTLKFDDGDEYATKDQLSPPYFSGIPMRTHDEVSQDADYVLQDFPFLK